MRAELNGQRSVPARHSSLREICHALLSIGHALVNALSATPGPRFVGPAMSSSCFAVDLTGPYKVEIICANYTRKCCSET